MPAWNTDWLARLGNLTGGRADEFYGWSPEAQWQNVGGALGWYGATPYSRYGQSLVSSGLPQAQYDVLSAGQQGYMPYSEWLGRRMVNQTTNPGAGTPASAGWQTGGGLQPGLQAGLGRLANMDASELSGYDEAEQRRMLLAGIYGRYAPGYRQALSNRIGAAQNQFQAMEPGTQGNYRNFFNYAKSLGLF